MEVGFLGLGIMGKAMSMNLLRHGFKVTVWNRTLSKCDELVEHGASIGETPAAVIKKCKYTIAMLSDPKRAGLKNKKNLRGLELWFSVVGLKGDDDQVLLDSLEAPPQLQFLGIFYYRGSSFPNWMMELNKLTHLMLVNCSECNVLPPIGKLQSLESLEIKNMPNVKMVGFEFLGNHEDAVNEGSSPDAIAFPKLRKLHFIKLDEWKEWTGINVNGGDKKIMPQLSSLSVVNCEKLESLPDYLKKKENLKPVIEGCPLLPENKKAQK